MKVQRGDVVLVDYPFSDGSGSKVRPTVVVQADQWNARLDDTILAVVTSSARRRVTTPTQMLIEVARLQEAATAEGRQWLKDLGHHSPLTSPPPLTDYPTFFAVFMPVTDLVAITGGRRAWDAS